MNNQMKPKTLEAHTNTEIMSFINDSQIFAINSIYKLQDELDAFINEAVNRLKEGHGRIIYVGAGTSIRLGVQDGVELTPTFGWPKERIDFAIAGGKKALMEAVEGAEDDVQMAKEGVSSLNLNELDVCICISASGMTPYTVAACKAARKAGALTMGISNAADSALLKASEFGVFIDSGEEVIKGSTRMAAGTAQKVMLNTISTLIMIRLSRVYNGLMVDVALNNKKLIKRAKLIIQEITGCSYEVSEQTLEAADGNIKVAVLMVFGKSIEDANELMNKFNGDLSKAIDSTELN
jgi:N-acetylmuramic acid 6-phosphate etherase